LEAKSGVIEFDVSYNHYSADYIENLLRGAARSNSLLGLYVSGMKGTVNLNALCLVDMIAFNSTIQEISIDMDLDLIDENMV
jgi:hypothetical protein